MTSGEDYTATISFQLSQVGARLAQEFADRLRQLGLTPREFAVLSSIEREGPRTQQQLADSLTMHRNNMATLADQMHRAGLIERRPHPQDGRALQVRLTTLGRRRLSAAAAVAPALDAEVTEQLPPEQLAAVRSALSTLTTALHLSPGIHPHLAVNYPGDRTRPGSPAGIQPTATSE